MGTSLTKQLQRRRVVVEKIAALVTELSEIDSGLFPRIEALAAVIDGQNMQHIQQYSPKRLDPSKGQR